MRKLWTCQLEQINNKVHKQQSLDRPLHTLEDRVFGGGSNYCHFEEFLAIVAKAYETSYQQLISFNIVLT